MKVVRTKEARAKVLAAMQVGETLEVPAQDRRSWQAKASELKSRGAGEWRSKREAKEYGDVRFVRVA